MVSNTEVIVQLQLKKLRIRNHNVDTKIAHANGFVSTPQIVSGIMNWLDTNAIVIDDNQYNSLILIDGQAYFVQSIELEEI
jgi:hypothetical protein